MQISACIFDLDGVIVDTAVYHYKAWRQLANDLGFDFSEKQNEKLKGVSRVDSLNLILQWGNYEMSEADKIAWAAKKNNQYLSFIATMTRAEILPGVLDFLDDLKDRNIKIALGSASKNAPRILNTLNLTPYFESVIDGTKTVKGKPDPEVFLKAAAELGVSPRESIVFEDAPKGVDAAINGGFYAIGIGREADLGHAHKVIPGFSNQNFESVCAMLSDVHIPG